MKDAFPMIVACCKHQPLYKVSTCPLCFEEKAMQYARCALCEIKQERGHER